MSELESANEVIAVYKMKEEEMAKKEKKMKRMASLLEAGIDNEVAISTTDKFESLNDEAFDAMTSLLSLAAKKMTEKNDYIQILKYSMTFKAAIILLKTIK